MRTDSWSVHGDEIDAKEFKSLVEELIVKNMTENKDVEIDLLEDGEFMSDEEIIDNLRGILDEHVWYRVLLDKYRARMKTAETLITMVRDSDGSFTSELAIQTNVDLFLRLSANGYDLAIHEDLYGGEEE